MSEIRTNVIISEESNEYRSKINLSVANLDNNLYDNHSAFRTNINISTTLKDGSIQSIKTILELGNISLDFYLVDMTKLNQSILYFSKFFNMYFEPEVMWNLLSQGTNEQINISHLSNALSSYVKNTSLDSINTSIVKLKDDLNSHISNKTIHLSNEEKSFLKDIMVSPPWTNGSGGGGYSESFFELIDIGNGEYALVPKKYKGKNVGIISDTFITAGGINSNSSDSEITFNRLDSWENYDESAGDVLSAVLGFDLKQRIEIIERNGTLNETQLNAYLSKNKYLTRTVADTIYATSSALNTINTNLSNHIIAYNSFAISTNNSLSNHNNRLISLENMFEWDGSKIKAKADFYSIGAVTAGGVSDGGSIGNIFNRLDTWDNYDANSGDVLSAVLGYELKTRIDSIENSGVSGDYLPLSNNGDVNVYNTVKGVVNFCNSGTEGEVGIRVKYGSVNGGGVWYNPSKGINLYNGVVGAELGILDSEATPYFGYNNRQYSLIHSGNYQSYALPRFPVIVGKGEDLKSYKYYKGLFSWVNGNNPSNSYGDNAVMLALTTGRDVETLQMVFAANESNAAIYPKIVVRSNWANTNWTSWYELIHSGNIGQYISGGGTACLPLSGGTLSGSLIVRNSGSGVNWVSDTGQIRVNATGTNYYLGLGVTSSGLALIQSGNSGTGAIALVINNNDTINTSSNVLIGTTEDSGKKLQVVSRSNQVAEVRSSDQEEASISYVNKNKKQWVAGVSAGGIGDGFGIWSLTAGKNILSCLANGNVLIGNTTDRGHILAVQAVSTSGSINITNLNKAGFSIGMIDQGYGMNLWTEGSGKGYIQQGRTDGSGTLYELVLQPFGGRVSTIASHSTVINSSTYGLIIGGRYSAMNYNSGIAFCGLHNYQSSDTYANHAHAWIGLGPYLNLTGPEVYPFVIATNSSTTTGAAPDVRLMINPLTGVTTIYGNFVATGEVTSGSDARYKRIESYAEIDIETIANAPIINFKWTDREDNKLHLGSTAQYWYNTSLSNGVIPTDDDKLWTMGYGQIALAGLVSVAKKVVNHEERIKVLEEENKQLKQQLNEYRRVS